MVREFQKHTDGSPIPRSDIGDRARQVDSRAVSFAARRRTLPVAANTAGFLLSLSLACISRENAIDPINATRNSPLSRKTFGNEYFLESWARKKDRYKNFVSYIFFGAKGNHKCLD